MLKVLMNGTIVGVLSQDKSGGLFFRYAESWLLHAQSRPISLSLPLSEMPYKGSPVQNFFENLLPDSPRVLDRIRTRFHLISGSVYEILAAIGRDCIGALQFVSDSEDADVCTGLQGKCLDEKEIESLLQSLSEFPLGMDGSPTFRISLAGAQEKTALLRRNGRWYKPLGMTPTTHILKLPMGMLSQNGIDFSESCENEWLCLEMVRAFGLDAAHSELLHFGRQTVLAVERFDRLWSADCHRLLRLPTEDFCQALGVPPFRKYESDGGPGIPECMELLKGSQNAIKDRMDFFAAQVVFWMLEAIDGHAKNFSLYIHALGRYRLAPLYDILSIAPAVHAGTFEHQKARLAMSWRSKKKHDRIETVLPRHFISTASQVGMDVGLCEDLLQNLSMKASDVIHRIEAVSKDIPNRVKEPIFESVYKKSLQLKRNC